MSQTSDNDNILKLVTEVYASIMAPERFMDVLELWDKSFFAESRNLDAKLDLMDRHLTHALPLLETSLREVINKDELITRISDYDRPSLLIAANCFIIGSNPSGRKFFNLNDGDQLDTSLMPASIAKKFGDMLKAIEGEGKTKVFQLFHLPIEKHSGVVEEHLVLARSASVSNSSHAYMHISSMDFHMPPKSVQAFKSAFGLTDAEMKILVSLVSGLRLTDIASKMGIRDDTVKKHIRQIRDKTKTANTTALVCLAASFSQLSNGQAGDGFANRENSVVVTNKSNQTYIKPTQHSLAQVNGRRLEYVDFGSDNKKVIMIMHSSMIGFILPPEFIRVLVDNGYRVIIPFRPGNGVSDPMKKAFSLKETAKHLLAFADTLGLEKFSVIGGTVGFSYAFKMAALEPDRIEGIIGIAGYLPVDPDKIRADMARYQRGVLFTLQHNRSLAKFLVLSGYKMFLQLGAHGFLSQIMRNSKSDLAVLDDAKSLGLLSVGLRIGGAQGVDALLNDSVLILSDWSHVLKDLKHTVHLFHGDEDSVFKIDTVREFCAANHRFRLTELKNTGQLMIYQNPRKIASMVIEKLERSNGIDKT